jgi:hypothetical protein
MGTCSPTSSMKWQMRWTWLELLRTVCGLTPTLSSPSVGKACVPASDSGVLRCAPGRTRTCNLLIRSHLECPSGSPESRAEPFTVQRNRAFRGVDRLGSSLGLGGTLRTSCGLVADRQPGPTRHLAAPTGSGAAAAQADARRPPLKPIYGQPRLMRGVLSLLKPAVIASSTLGWTPAGPLPAAPLLRPDS